MNELVSVIIPTYNRGNLIKKSIESVLSQDYQNIEIIVVDDGSTDNTKDILQEIKDSRLHCFFLNHGGACLARNKGINEAKGKYITFLDSDDTYRPNKISCQLKRLIESKSDIVFCAFDRHDKNKTETIPSFENGMIFKEKNLLTGNCITTQTLFGKAECFKKNLFDEEMPRLQDWDIAIRLVGKYKLTFFNDVLVDQYIQDDSISRKNHLYISALKRIIIKYANLYEQNRDDLLEVLNTLVKASKEDDNQNINIDELIEERDKWHQNYEKALNKIEEIENSRAWKITKPFRTILDKLKK